jgi:hypothetical protein
MLGADSSLLCNKAGPEFSVKVLSKLRFFVDGLDDNTGL